MNDGGKAMSWQPLSAPELVALNLTTKRKVAVPLILFDAATTGT